MFIAFMLSALLGVPSGSLKAIPGVSNSVSEGIVLPILSDVLGYVDDTGFFRNIRRCSYYSSENYLAYIVLGK